MTSFKVTHFGITGKPSDCVLLHNNVGFRV